MVADKRATGASGCGGCTGGGSPNGVLDHLQSERALDSGNCGAHSEVQLGAAPVAASGVVPDFVVSAVADPVGQGTVLLDLLAVLDLLAE